MAQVCGYVWGGEAGNIEGFWKFLKKFELQIFEKLGGCREGGCTWNSGKSKKIATNLTNSYFISATF